LEYLIIVYAVLLTSAYIFMVPLKQLIRRNLLLLLIFVVPMSLPAVFVAVVGGKPLDSWGLLSLQGIQSFLIISTRTLCVISLVQLLISIMSVTEILRGLLQLRVSASVVSLFSTMWSYLHILGREAHTMAMSLRARTVSPTATRRAYATFGFQGSVLLQKCLQTAEATHRAMLARGFRSTFGFLPQPQPFGARDVLAIVGGSMLALLGYL
jgi:energy-coupling factor transporter transmembrane protein EcfT